MNIWISVTFFMQLQLIEKLADLLPKEMQTEMAEAVIGLTLIFLLAAFVHFVIRVWIVRFLLKLDERTATEWYAVILKHNLPQRALFMIPLVIIYNGIEIIPQFNEEMTNFIIRITAAAMILVGARVFDAFLSSLHTLYLMRPEAHLTPIKSYIQLGK
ncbi:MAG: hypothetical protein GVY02_06465, partial [Bacteroidetes bacterium]|nr:hypothetical protein [Bacteroidota bacterium]